MGKRPKTQLTHAPARHPLDNQTLSTRRELLAAFVEGTLQYAVGAAPRFVECHEHHGAFARLEIFVAVDVAVQSGEGSTSGSNAKR